MSRFKYDVQDQLSSNVAPLSAAIGLALSATTLQAATITVTTLNDGSVLGQCTLRDALLSANGDVETAGCDAGFGADDIVFQTGLTGTLNLNGGLLPISSEITITGPGPSQLTISGDGSDRLIGIESAGTTNISGLRLQNGYVNDLFGGAAIVVISSALTLSNCEIANNTSGPTAYGGAITLSSASLTLDQCTLSGNSVEGGVTIRGSANAFGGGLLAVSSQATITDSTFDSNSADSYGGGLALVNSMATVSASRFTANEALIGGGISVGGNSVLEMDDSAITGNTAYGGGGLVVGSMSSANLLTTDIYSNNAFDFGGGVQVGVGFTSPVTLQEPNQADRPLGSVNFSLTGPGLLSFESGYLALNSSTYAGGGLAAKYESSVAISDSDVIYNEAVRPVMPRGAGQSERGGMSPPKARGGGLAALDSAYIAVVGTNLYQNISELGGGGFADYGGELALGESIISSNTAELGGGLLAGYQDSPPLVTRGEGDARGGPSNGGSIAVNDSQVIYNYAGYAGGGIAAAFDGAAFVKYSQVNNNIAAYYGGGAAAFEGDMLISNTLVKDNISNTGGGVFSLVGDALVEIFRSTITGNSALIAGGLRLESQNARLKYSTVSGNSAGAVGGVLIVGTPMVDSRILNSTITDNSADEIGGLYASAASLDFLTVSHNSSTALPDPRNSRLAERGMIGNPGGALLNANVEVSNSIFSDSVSPGGTLDLSIIEPGSVTIDYSLIETPSEGVISGSGNLFDIDPQLGILAVNGGPTATRALGPLSPAVDVADPSTTVGADQRGDPFPRVFNGRADMGAFEFFIDSIFSDRFEQP